MEGTKEVIPGHIKVAIVAFKVAMVKVVEIIGVNSKLVDLNPIKARVSPGRADSRVE